MYTPTVNPVMEVACKRGPLVSEILYAMSVSVPCVSSGATQAGSTVPMASLLLADPTRSCLKLLLWREAACWVERIVAGDILLLKCETAHIKTRHSLQFH